MEFAKLMQLAHAHGVTVVQAANFSAQNSKAILADATLQILRDVGEHADQMENAVACQVSQEMIVACSVLV
jgi:collagenase-like PrtC family protease